MRTVHQLCTHCNSPNKIQLCDGDAAIIQMKMIIVIIDNDDGGDSGSVEMISQFNCVLITLC